MDNIEHTEVPVGEAGATASPDNTTIDTQPVEAEASVSDGAIAETVTTSAPWESDPRFKGKTPEEMYAIVQEADKYKGELGRKAKAFDLIGQKTGLTPEQLEAQMAQMELQAQQERYANDPIAPVMDKVSYLEAKIQAQEQEKANIALENEVNSFVQENQAYANSRDKILKLVKTPGIGFDPVTGNDLGSVADIAREWIGETRAQGQQDAYKKIETKIMTQATPVRSVPSKTFTLEDMQKMSVAELEAILPHN